MRHFSDFTKVCMCVLLLTHGQQAIAEPLQKSDIESGSATIEPQRGYLYLTAPNRLAGTLIRIADEEDIAEYRAARNEAFTEATKEYEEDHAKWRKRAARARSSSRNPEEPVRPSEESFPFASIERYFASSFGPINVYSRNSGSYDYLEELKPGTYIWYGPIFLGNPAQGYVGQCYCMGTVQFDVEAGIITNLGNSLLSLPRWQDDANAPPLKIKHNGGFSGYVIDLPIRSGELNYQLPPSLVRYPSEIPKLRAHGKINNFYSKMISRIAPIDGVIAYDRDKVIDLNHESSFERIDPN